MLVRVPQSTPSWVTRKCLCLPHLATPSISRYFCSIDFSDSSLWVLLWRSLLLVCWSFPFLCFVPSINFSLTFQTLYVEPGLCLCDCPGLVMPSFVSTKAEMICSGILPIDQMRDHIPPVSLISFPLYKNWLFLCILGLQVCLGHCFALDKFTNAIEWKNLKYWLVIFLSLYNEVAAGLWEEDLTSQWQLCRLLSAGEPGLWISAPSWILTLVLDYFYYLCKLA